MYHVMNRNDDLASIWKLWQVIIGEVADVGLIHGGIKPEEKTVQRHENALFDQPVRKIPAYDAFFYFCRGVPQIHIPMKSGKHPAVDPVKPGYVPEEFIQNPRHPAAGLHYKGRIVVQYFHFFSTHSK